MTEKFQDRLKQVFDNASMAEIARRLELPHATVRNYFQGRMPAPDVLIKIANETNVSLNWLLTGKGELFAGGTAPLQALDNIFEKRIEEMIDRKLAERLIEIDDLGEVDARPEFDAAAAIRKYNDPRLVMNEWFLHEGRKYPEDYGVVFFQGWETYTDEEKLDAVKDAKKVLDRTLKKE
jgi:transcriptional regulator with XRE-family HTH domain